MAEALEYADVPLSKGIAAKIACVGATVCMPLAQGLIMIMHPSGLLTPEMVRQTDMLLALELSLPVIGIFLGIISLARSRIIDGVVIFCLIICLIDLADFGQFVFWEWRTLGSLV